MFSRKYFSSVIFFALSRHIFFRHIDIDTLHTPFRSYFTLVFFADTPINIFFAFSIIFAFLSAVLPRFLLASDTLFADSQQIILAD
jgi:hypothetical protein